MRILKFLRSLVAGASSDSAPPYCYADSHTVVRDFGEFSQIPLPEIERRIRSFRESCKREWESLPASDFAARAKSFYSTSQHYIYDLLENHPSLEAVVQKLDNFEPRIMESIRTHPGETFLEFGGGTGALCEIVSRLGKKVTYLDIPGIPMEFATWRFKKYDCRVRVTQSQPGRYEIEGSYDVVFTDAVIEHLPPPEQGQAVEALCGAVNPSGLLILMVDLSGDCDEFPMHTKVDIRRLHGIVQSRGFESLAGRGRFCSVWRRP